jgi:hypothetical protein
VEKTRGSSLVVMVVMSPAEQHHYHHHHHHHHHLHHHHYVFSMSLALLARSVYNLNAWRKRVARLTTTTTTTTSLYHEPFASHSCNV